MMKKSISAVILGLCIVGQGGMATEQAEFEHDQAVSRYFSTLRKDPSQLRMFIKRMPKGGGLHYHWDGSSYAENMLRYAKKDKLYVDPTTMQVTQHRDSPDAMLLEHLFDDTQAYNSAINRWSLRHMDRCRRGHASQFFATFGLFQPITDKHTPAFIAEVVNRAGEQGQNYLELMIPQQQQGINQLVQPFSLEQGFTLVRRHLIKAGVLEKVANLQHQINQYDKQLRKQLHCGTTKAMPGCAVTLRYQLYADRNQSPKYVFAQLLAAFESATRVPQIVAVNMVGRESDAISMRDYRLHMRMLAFFHKLYPKVSIALHAGELAQGTVPPEGMNHIRLAVELGHAQRIGHGVDISYEPDAEALLHQMAEQKILVEINLTSNADILGVKSKQHPLPLYLRHQVPVALSTDDEGVLRTDISEEFLKAVLRYRLSYHTVKQMVRDSLQYSFLSGKALWLSRGKVVAECANQPLGGQDPTGVCAKFLGQNEKARLQWRLEKQLQDFETQLV